MTSKPQVHSQFSVVSGCLCYGELHNIWHGASNPEQVFPPIVERRSGGTISSQIVQFNTVSRNGTWSAYQLIDQPTGRVCGWFACHFDVEPEAEIDRILQISGSPYESNSGNQFNNENTTQDAVFILNRYDWGYYDQNANDKVYHIEDDYPEIDEYYVAVGLADYAHAKEDIQHWQALASSQRGTLPTAIWMYIPKMEYMFGRFGFDAHRTVAQSFLFFTTDTVFHQTSFAGVDRILRTKEDKEEDIGLPPDETHVSDSQGVETIMEHAQMWAPSLPDKSQCLGPYETHEYPIRSKDLDAIRTRPGMDAPKFMDKYRESCEAYVNEMIMSYLEHFIAPASSSCDTITMAATLLFPNYQDSHIDSLHRCMYGFMLSPQSDPVQEFDTKAVGKRIKQFLTPKCGDNSLIRDTNFINGLTACVVYLLSEVIELANNSRLDSGRDRILPIDIRTSVISDEDLLKLFKFSKFLWES